MIRDNAVDGYRLARNFAFGLQPKPHFVLTRISFLFSYNSDIRSKYFHISHVVVIFSRTRLKTSLKSAQSYIQGGPKSEPKILYT